MTKTCSKCQIEKPSSEFNRHPTAMLGLQPQCKQCCRDYKKARYWADRKKYQIQNARRYQIRKTKPEYTRQRYLLRKKYREQNPEKHKAHRAVEYAIRKGRIQRGPCEKCGTTENVQAHHDDYSKVFEVRWFCFLHHREHHGKFVKLELS